MERNDERGRERGQGRDERARNADKSSHESRGKGADSDLKEREYRDAEGNVHHHTKTYMEQHKGERDEE